MSDSSFYSNTGTTSASISSITSLNGEATASKNAAATSATAASSSATAASTSATASQVSNAAALVSKNTATTQAALATSNGAAKVTLATAQVALATTQAGLATSNGAAKVTLATAQVALATTQANLATSNGAAKVTLAAAQVALATTQAGLATSNGAAKVTLATAQVALATTQAGLATSNGAAKVTLATAQAAIATTRANSATSSASAAATSATASAASASTANTKAATATSKAAEGVVSAASALSEKNAAVVAKNAAVTAKGDSETAEDNSVAAKNLALQYKNTATTHASTATTQANNSSSSASTAATKATEGAASAAAALVSKNAAAVSASAASTSLTSFTDVYKGSASSAPSGGTGDLYYDTNSNSMKVYNGSAWVAAYISAAGYANLSGSTFSGNITVPNLVLAGSGTVDGRDVSADGTKLDGVAASANNYVHPNHSGAVTSNADGATAIASNVALGGSPTTTTQSAADNSTKIATTAYTDAAIAALADSAPSTLNTLNELAAALGDDADYAATTTTAIGTKLPKAGGAMTGAITTNSTFDGRDVATDGSKLDGIAASANNYVHPNHSGEVTSTADGATVIAANVVDEANLKISNGPTNGQFLSAQSGNAGGLTWAVPTNTTYSVQDGQLSQINFTSADHSKLNGIAASANNYAHPTGAGNNHVPTGGSSGQFLKYSSSGVAVWAADNNTDTNTTYSVQDGGLSQNNFTDADHTKLNGIAASANNYSHPTGAGNNHVPTGGSSGQFLKYSSSGVAVWAADNNTDTNTTYSADGNYGMTLSGTAFRLEDDRRRNSATVDIYSGNSGDYTFYDADVGIRWYTAGAEEMRLTDAGDLHVDGNITAYSTTVSDERLKTDISTVENALDKVKQIRGVEFTRIKDGVRSAGVIAQELEKVLPQAITETALPYESDTETEFKTVDYDAIHALLIESIKELSDKIDALGNK